ncbi:MAG: hypothetical protein JNK65_06270 [Deltaproteobacteria bacterium]|nr:hypothetical protein [Deltaproteobacteria bacterium]
MGPPVIASGAFEEHHLPKSYSIIPPLSYEKSMQMPSSSIPPLSSHASAVSQNPNESDRYVGASELGAIQQGMLLAQNDPQQAKVLFQGAADAALVKKDYEDHFLAKGLLFLSDGKILDAKRYLEPIRNNPHAAVLLSLIEQNDRWLASLQNLYILKALCEDEKILNKDNPSLEKISQLFSEAEDLLKSPSPPSLTDIFHRLTTDPNKNYGDAMPLIENLGKGSGKKILDIFKISLDRVRAQMLIGLVKDELIPQQQAGTSYLISKIYENHPDFGKQAQDRLSELYGIRHSLYQIPLDVLNNGGNYFLVSGIALLASRYTYRGVYSLWVRQFGSTMAPWKKTLGMATSWLASTAAYYKTEHSILSWGGFEQTPQSGGDRFREFSGDLVITLAAHFLGIRFRGMEEKWFKPLKVSERFFRHLPARIRRGFGKLGFYSAYAGLQLGSSFMIQRFQDQTDFTTRFRAGKLSSFTPQRWDDFYTQGLELKSSEKLLGALLGHLIRVRSATVSDQLEIKIRKLKSWISKFYPSSTAEQEERLLGIFWAAQERKDFAGGAPDILLKWFKEKRFQKINDYFTEHRIALRFDDQGELQFL